VQTFLPYDDFERVAHVLDDRRLGKQRVEVLQIMRALTVPGYGWQHHPAVLMWKGHEEGLAAYGFAICREWRRRGYADTCEAKIAAAAEPAGVGCPRSQAELAREGLLPPWLGNPALHRSHRSALLRKDPAHYADRFPGERDDLDYVWPVRAAGQPGSRRRTPPSGRTGGPGGSAGS
jgi:hypothetical protein